MNGDRYKNDLIIFSSSTLWSASISAAICIGLSGIQSPGPPLLYRRII